MTTFRLALAQLDVEPNRPDINVRRKGDDRGAAATRRRPGGFLTRWLAGFAEVMQRTTGPRTGRPPRPRGRSRLRRSR